MPSILIRSRRWSGSARGDRRRPVPLDRPPAAGGMWARSVREGFRLGGALSRAGVRGQAAGAAA